MTWLTVMGFIAAIYVGLWLAARLGLFIDRDFNGEIEADDTATVMRWALPIVGLLALAITAFSSYEQVEAGHVGVVREFGAIVGTLDEGPNFIPPWRDVSQVNIQTRTTFFGITKDDGELREFQTLEAASKETQDLFITASVSWRVDGTAADSLIREVGTNFFDRIGMQQRMEKAIKETTTSYLAVDAPGARDEIGEAAEVKLAAILSPFYIEVDSINIANIGFSPQFNAAIEDKQVATQQALAAQERVETARAEAAQRIASAEGDAQAAVATAKGEAEAAVEVAKGNAEVIRVNAAAQAEANITIANSLTPELIRFRALDQLPSTTVFLPSDGTVNLLDIAAALSSETAAPVLP